MTDTRLRPVFREEHDPLETTPETARRNVLWGLALFGFVVLLFAGTILVALLYLAVAD